MFIIFLICLTLYSSVKADSVKQKADFLVIENPTALIIYNKYEQEISAGEQLFFRPYSPFKLLQTNSSLSDGFTSCMEIRVNHQKFYLIKDEKGRLANQKECGYVQMFTNTILFEDTIEVLAENSLFLSKRPTFKATAKSQKYFLKTKERLQRLFRHKNWTYVKKLSIKPDFGWSYLAANKQNKLWKLSYHKASERNTEITAQLTWKIEQKIVGVNTVLKKLFEHFNRTTHQERPIPYWKMTIKENQIVCLLENDQYRQFFSESNQYFINSLENMILGTSFKVLRKDGMIEIQAK